MQEKTLDMRELVSNLNNKELLNIGLQDFVYVRPLSFDDKELYAIHAADGTPLSIMDSLETAMDKISQSDLEAVTLH